MVGVGDFGQDFGREKNGGRLLAAQYGLQEKVNFLLHRGQYGCPITLVLFTIVLGLMPIIS